MRKAPPNPRKKMVAFRFTTDADRALKYCARHLRRSKTAALEMAIRKFADQLAAQ